MISIISGTDRKDGLTHTLADHYHTLIKLKTTSEVNLFSLEDLPPDLYGHSMYHLDTISNGFQNIENQYLINPKKILFVMPEYNGSFPGILKLFVDAASIRGGSDTLKGKKVALTGVATGRAGNIRGLEHFASIMMFMGAAVLPNMLPISTFHKMMDENKTINDAKLLAAIEKQVEEFLEF